MGMCMCVHVLCAYAHVRMREYAFFVRMAHTLLSVMTAGSWKHMLLPAPVGITANASPPSNSCMMTFSCCPRKR